VRREIAFWIKPENFDAFAVPTVLREDTRIATGDPDFEKAKGFLKKSSGCRHDLVLLVPVSMT
jgi:hypothetical protein